MMCAMKLQHEVSYAASPDRVFEMLADPAFREAAVAAQGVVSAEVELTRTGGGFSLTVDQIQKTDDLPSFARSITGDTTRVVQSEEWADTTGGTLKIESPGKPTGVNGTVTLRPEGSRTLEIVELDIAVKVPLIGGKLEKLLADKIRAGIDAEHGVGMAWLEGNR
jgi:uncharacterized protein YndB with AHSA1/START domain